MSSYADRLQALRDQLKTDRLDGFVVPLTDEHMSEYVDAYAQRLAWLTGFQGSAGTAVVMPAEAAVFTDGRYTLQVREQVDGQHWEFVSVPETSISAWMAAHAASGARVGYDPWLHTRGWVVGAAKALGEVGAELVAVRTNPVDAVWPDRPAPSAAKLTIQNDAAAGKSSSTKRQEIADWLASKKADAVVLSALDSIAWLFNVRGADVAHTPVALAYAIVYADATADLFVEPDKITEAVRQHLGNAVCIHDRARFASTIANLAGQHIAADPDNAVAAVFDTLEAGGATVLALRDPVVMAKAIKNHAEVAGHKSASLRDGAALSRFLRWVEQTAPKGGLTELDCVTKLLEFREATGKLKDTSFDTISATGAHGASPHYHSTPESNAELKPGDLYLVDSGGQYTDGTTDVTRVIAVGDASHEMKDRFTRVLKGHIALDTALFPKGTNGGQLDGFARRPLWDAGLDFAHGTGHGVGAYLSVHEGPARIAKPHVAGGGPLVPLEPGMILSNEPGYYKAGEYGIRIENLVLVIEREVPGGDTPMLGLETLTFVPIERGLILPEMLNPDEIAWLNSYHAKVLERIGPVLTDKGDREWLACKCAPVV